MQETTSFISRFFQSAIGGSKQLFVSLYCFFTGTPRGVWGLIALAIALLCLLLYVSRRWVQAKPNQWLLVIRNGKMIKAGVGLKVWKTPLDAVVTFPSKVQRVYFSANNVTVQMQGIIIQGFAFWSVFRDDDGPFRCYKYLQGCDTNDSIKALCESVLRNLIANSTIDQVMKNRNHLRVNMQKQLKDQFKGWGIWLESVEITDVRISSEKLFKDLQAEFRQQIRLKAEFIELNGNEKMQETRQTSDLKMSQKNQLNQTKRLQANYQQQYKRKTQEEAYLSGKVNLEIEKMTRDRDFQIQRIKNDQQKQTEKLKNAQSIQDQQQTFALQAQKRNIQMDNLYDEKTLRKYRIDATEKIYNNLTVKDLKLNQYSSQSNLLGVFPTLPASE